MATMMWCADCEKEAKVFTDPNNVMEFHFNYLGKDDIVGCFGPFYTSAPSELEDGWQDELVEPSVEELQEMDQGAELLLWDLGLMEK